MFDTCLAVARRPRVFAPGLLYHVIVRGNQQRKTFLGEDDYKTYLERLEHYRTKFDVRIYAYSLMPNHRASEVAKLLGRDHANISMMLLRSSATEED